MRKIEKNIVQCALNIPIAYNCYVCNSFLCEFSRYNVLYESDNDPEIDFANFKKQFSNIA